MDLGITTPESAQSCQLVSNLTVQGQSPLAYMIHAA